MNTERNARKTAPTGGRSVRRGERFFAVVLALLALLIAAGWTAAMVDLRAQSQASAVSVAASVTASAPAPVARSVTGALLDPEASTTAYLDEAAIDFLEPLRGESGKLQMAFRTPEGRLAQKESSAGATAVYVGEAGEAGRGPLAPRRPGIYGISVELGKARREVERLSLVTLVPFSEKKDSRIGLYYLGNWPYEGGEKPRSSAYASPEGFVEVTLENRDQHVSEHFRLRDFLTKGQSDVWPKYLVIDPKLIDKLELVIQELESQGHAVRHVQIMSGFRTPYYNHAGGNTGGRANLSRHMYGDAADVFVDDDRNGTMDDLNHDGRLDVRDAEVLARAVERVEAAHPALVGGVGIYKACCGHGPFTHVDVRGYRARWRGEGSG
jgi:uncharacterized protein YcbK (DUF882 family)